MLVTFGILKSWQGVVEVILRVVCFVLVVVTFICSAAAAGALSAERTGIIFVEDLRFDTRSPVGWILLLAILSLPLLLLLLVVRFVDVRFISERGSIFLIIDILISAALSVGYFCGAVPMAVHTGDWKFWSTRGSSEEIARYNLDGITASVGASAAFSFLSTFALIALLVWLVLTLVLRWGENNMKYKRAQEFQPKVQMVTSDDEVSVS